MSDLINVPQAIQSLNLRPLFDMDLSVSGVQRFGGESIRRQVGVVSGGRFAGERLRGEILGIGADWQTILEDGTVQIDCRIVLKTDDGASITMEYKGVRSGSAEVLARLGNGEEVDASQYYFRINPLFQTAAPQYAWLNRMITIGAGHRLPGGPVYRIFEVL